MFHFIRSAGDLTSQTAEFFHQGSISGQAGIAPNDPPGGLKIAPG
jgi:hypothetical protein